MDAIIIILLVLIVIGVWSIVNRPVKEALASNKQFMSFEDHMKKAEEFALPRKELMFQFAKLLPESAKILSSFISFIDVIGAKLLPDAVVMLNEEKRGNEEGSFFIGPSDIKKVGIDGVIEVFGKTNHDYLAFTEETQNFLPIII